MENNNKSVFDLEKLYQQRIRNIEILEEAHKDVINENTYDGKRLNFFDLQDELLVTQSNVDVKKLWKEAKQKLKDADPKKLVFKSPKKMEDKIKPEHYPNSGGNDLIQFALDNNVSAIEFNVMKYVLRWKDKNGLEDLKKCREYLDRLIKNEEEK